jgi:hypothetical protein
MPPTNHLDLADPAFAPIKARLVRSYLDHKADMGVPDASDESIVSHIDDITAILMAGVARAVATNNGPFMQRYGWFVEACADLLRDLPDRLDG